MVSTDPISDMLTRIRNAALVNYDQVSLPYSRVKEEIARILVNSGFLKAVRINEAGGRKQLLIEITGAGQPAKFTEIKRVSKPGRRVYVQAKQVPIVKRGRGVVIVSTSQGMMTGADAVTKRLGGELICEVY